MRSSRLILFIRICTFLRFAITMRARSDPFTENCSKTMLKLKINQIYEIRCGAMRFGLAFIFPHIFPIPYSFSCRCQKYVWFILCTFVGALLSGYKSLKVLDNRSVYGVQFQTAFTDDLISRRRKKQCVCVCFMWSVKRFPCFVILFLFLFDSVIPRKRYFRLPYQTHTNCMFYT